LHKKLSSKILYQLLGLDRYRAGNRYPIPDTISRSCTDTDTGYNATQLGHVNDIYTTCRRRRHAVPIMTLLERHGQRRRDHHVVRMTTLLSARRVDKDDDVATTCDVIIIIEMCLL